MGIRYLGGCIGYLGPGSLASQTWFLFLPFQELRVNRGTFEARCGAYYCILVCPEQQKLPASMALATLGHTERRRARLSILQVPLCFFLTVLAMACSLLNKKVIPLIQGTLSTQLGERYIILLDDHLIMRTSFSL